jgi:Bacterial PH domain
MLVLAVLPALLAVVTLVVAFALAPQECSVQGNQLIVRTNAKTLTYDLNQMLGAQAVPASAVGAFKTIKLFGLGWPFKPYGYFRNEAFGTFLAFVTDRNKMVLLTFPDKKLLVSPMNPEALTSRTKAA